MSVIVNVLEDNPRICLMAFKIFVAPPPPSFASCFNIILSTP